ncbi:unnamed protein product [Parajaminaea phylloscopi]
MASRDEVCVAGRALATLAHEYAARGYVVVDGLFASEQLTHLRAIAAEVTELARTGRWPHIRRVGKQFPPFDTVTQTDCWGVQHLMHPDLPHSDEFQRFYGQDAFLTLAAGLLGCQRTELQMELFNLLVEPQHHAFALAWHRDDIRPDVGEREEQDTLAQPAWGVQWNAALWDDDCLFIVPGTHLRRRTPTEVRANETKAPEPRVCSASGEIQGAAGDSGKETFDGAWSIDPPETLRVHLKAGQTCFYSQRLLHRASYLPTRTRATLHGCYGQAHPQAKGARARMILQHDVEWLKDERFGQGLPDELKGMWKLLLSEYAGQTKQDHGYSLDG